MTNINNESTETTNSTTQKTTKPRHRLTKEEEKRIKIAICTLYNTDTPMLVIQKELELSKSKFDGFLADLFLSGEIAKRETGQKIVKEAQVHDSVKKFLMQFKDELKDKLFEIIEDDNSIMITLYKNDNGANNNDISK